MTIFVYISRRPKVYGRPKQRLTTVNQPSGLSWKRPLTRRWQPRRLARTLLGERSRRLRYPIAGPPASFLPTKRAFRIRIRRSRRFVRLPRLYSIAGPPAGFIAQKRMPRPRIKRVRLRIRPKLLPILPSLLLLYRKLPRLKLKRARTPFIRRRYSIAGPPASVIPYKRFPRARIKRGKWNLRRFAQRLYVVPAVGPIVVTAIEFLIKWRRRGRR